MFLHFVCLAAITASWSTTNIADPDSCQSMEVPVGFVKLNPGPAPDFSPADLIPTFGKDTAVLRSMALNEGPRRILLVMDRDKSLSADTRQGEQLILETILSLVRQDDQLALITARGPRQVVPFTRDHDELLRTLESDEKSASRGKGVLDAALDGIEMFGSPNPGDAIVVIAAHLGGSHGSSPRQILTSLLQHRIRLFGIALGPVARHYQASINQTTVWQTGNGSSSTITTSAFDIGDENFHSFTTASGGFVLVAMNPYPFSSDRIKDPSVAALINTQTKAIVELVTRYFRVEVEVPRPGPWRLDLSEASRKNAPGVLLLYPHELWPCAH